VCGLGLEIAKKCFIVKFLIYKEYLWMVVLLSEKGYGIGKRI
jgi:hypothetical protein